MGVYMVSKNNDAPLFKESPQQEELETVPLDEQQPWKLLIADDDQEIHAITQLVLHGFKFENRPLQFLNAYSGKDALEMLVEHPDTAIILLDVVMETDDAGLQVARTIRNQLHNYKIRIVLRTGQPGQAPESRVIFDYDINDYRAKTELTAERLTTTIVSSLRSYRDLQGIEYGKKALIQLIEGASELFKNPNSELVFHEQITNQLDTLIPIILYENCQQISSLVAQRHQGHVRIISGSGDFGNTKNKAIDDMLSPQHIQLINKTFSECKNQYGDDEVAIYVSGNDNQNPFVIFLDNYCPNNVWSQQLIDLFTIHASIAYKNMTIRHNEHVSLTRVDSKQNPNDPSVNTDTRVLVESLKRPDLKNIDLSNDTREAILSAANKNRLTELHDIISKLSKQQQAPALFLDYLSNQVERFDMESILNTIKSLPNG